ncbi:MAG TPA: hypothetical protein VF972_07925, partial [Actinomycetota bacterium]
MDDPASPITAVPVGVFRPERFEAVLPKDSFETFMGAVTQAANVFAGRVVWNVNSTARGGGVAEMLRSLVAYARGAGVDARWAVISGTPPFFEVTKRLHNHLHGFAGDRGPLGDRETEVYREAAALNAGALATVVHPDDVVILHDPQTAGLCAAMKETGATVLWR